MYSKEQLHSVSYTTLYPPFSFRKALLLQYQLTEQNMEKWVFDVKNTILPGNITPFLCTQRLSGFLQFGLHLSLCYFLSLSLPPSLLHSPNDDPCSNCVSYRKQAERYVSGSQSIDGVELQAMAAAGELLAFR